jgi:hypothetical protein
MQPDLYLEEEIRLPRKRKERKKKRIRRKNFASHHNILPITQ